MPARCLVSQALRPCRSQASGAKISPPFSTSWKYVIPALISQQFGNMSYLFQRSKITNPSTHAKNNYPHIWSHHQFKLWGFWKYLRYLVVFGWFWWYSLRDCVIPCNQLIIYEPTIGFFLFITSRLSRCNKNITVNLVVACLVMFFMHDFRTILQRPHISLCRVQKPELVLTNFLLHYPKKPW